MMKGRIYANTALEGGRGEGKEKRESRRAVERD